MVGFVGVDECEEFAPVEGEIVLWEGGDPLLMNSLKKVAGIGIYVAPFCSRGVEDIEANMLDLLGDNVFGGKGEPDSFGGSNASTQFTEFPERATEHETKKEVATRLERIVEVL